MTVAMLLHQRKVRRKNHNTAPSYVITHYHYVRVMERYTETLHVEKMADLP